MLSWCLLLSDSLFSSHPWGIALALFLRRITVERPVLFFGFIVILLAFVYYVLLTF